MSENKQQETKSVVNKRFYNFARPLCNFVFRLFLPTRLIGTENVPQQGAFILCANHVTMADPIMISLKTGKRYVRFLAKAELFEKKPVAWLLRALGSFPVRRGQTDMAAMRESLRLLSEGHAVGIFPQGTRNSDNLHSKMENGVALIALRAKVPVIPAYVGGKFKLFRKTTIAFGKPIQLEDLWGRFDAESMSETTHRVEEAIWKLQDC